MDIQLRRIRFRPDTIDGQIWIDGMRVCDSAENNKFALAPGTYPITLVKCHQHSRKMPVIMLPACESIKDPEFQSSSNLETLEHETLKQKCSACPKLPYVGNNSTMPMICPMLKPGNGVYNRTDGSIIVGKYLAPGCLVHPKTTFDNLFERIRKNAERGNEINIIISSLNNSHQ